MQTMYYIGLDVHKRTISYCVKEGSALIHFYPEGTRAERHGTWSRALRTRPDTSGPKWPRC